MLSVVRMWYSILTEYLNIDIRTLTFQTYDKRMCLVEKEEKRQASEFLLHKFISSMRFHL